MRTGFLPLTSADKKIVEVAAHLHYQPSGKLWSTRVETAERPGRSSRAIPIATHLLPFDADACLNLFSLLPWSSVELISGLKSQSNVCENTLLVLENRVKFVIFPNCDEGFETISNSCLSQTSFFSGLTQKNKLC